LTRPFSFSACNRIGDALRRVGKDDRTGLSQEGGPDANTLLKFRRLLEKHNLPHTIFEPINPHLSAQGLMMREGIIVDATLIAAPPWKDAAAPEC
jgi:IS5 family transposase